MKLLTEAEMRDLAIRTQDYIDRMHEFARVEAAKADIPVGVAIPAIVGWAMGIARMAGVSVGLVDLEAEDLGDDDPPVRH